MFIHHPSLITMYIILTIDDLKKHVESMCNNFEISFVKFFGESN
jgi:hypothetical protein